jgi:hypothetical protein
LTVWGDNPLAANVSIQLNDKKKTENSSDKIEKYPAVTTLPISRHPQNGDLLLDYLKHTKPLVQEMILAV